MSYTIRAAEVSDLDLITELYLTYTEELRKSGLQYEINVGEVPAVLETRIKSRLFHVAVAESDGKLGAFIICSIARIGREYLFEGSGQTGYLNDVYVLPELRKCGCANALLEDTKSWLKGCGVNTLELEVLRDNVGGKVFWEKSGCHEIGTFYGMKF